MSFSIGGKCALRCNIRAVANDYTLYVRNLKAHHADKHLVMDWEPLDQLTTPLGKPKPRREKQNAKAVRMQTKPTFIGS